MVELTEVEVVIVRGSVFPAAEEDADPFEGQGPDGGVKGLPFALEHGDIGPRPAALRERTPGELVERLPEEFGTSLAFVDNTDLAALTLDRGGAAELLHLQGRVVTLPIGAEGGD